MMSLQNTVLSGGDNLTSQGQGQDQKVTTWLAFMSPEKKIEYVYRM